MDIDLDKLRLEKNVWYHLLSDGSTVKVYRGDKLVKEAAVKNLIPPDPEPEPQPVPA